MILTTGTVQTIIQEDPGGQYFILHLSLQKNMYTNTSKEINITRNLTQSETISLSPEFGFLDIQSTPEQGAEVYINNPKAGFTPYKSQ